MREKIIEEMNIPSGVECTYHNSILSCASNGKKSSRHIKLPRTLVSISDEKIKIECKSGNKNNLKLIKSQVAHIKNMFAGLQNPFVYKMQECNVHFPMTLKVEKDKLAINNFLGEKKPRYAEILNNVDVKVNGQNIEVSSHIKELAGQTAANIEKATKVKYRDRRVFQDGIYIIEKTGGSE